MKRRLFYLSIFLLSTGFTIRHCAPSVTTGDSGEFMTAASTLSIPHAPSYPLFSILGKAFIQMIPWGTPALRSNYFSSICSGLTLLFVCGIVFALGGGGGAAAIVAILIGTSHSFWMNSLVTEVFALNSMWACLLLWVGFKYKNYFLSAFLMGLGLGNHHILIFLTPSLLLQTFSGFQDLLNYKKWLALIFMGSIGASIYLFLPVRSSKAPPLNWGQPTTAHKLYRTITRQDYGSLKLAIGETPERTIRNTGKQLERFVRQLSLELPWPLIILGFLGFIVGINTQRGTYLQFFIAFLLTGPFFFILGNLPMTSLSAGIMGRFFILPAIFIILGTIDLLKKFRRTMPLFLCILAVLMALKEYSQAQAHRRDFLVWDYSNSMLRTLPSGAALFLEGGDDAFYGLATQQFVFGKRPDAAIHDRGGLIFRNPYGSDFRTLTQPEKSKRRIEVEKKYLNSRPVFYSSMDPQVLPGVTARENGLLLEAGGTNPILPWALICLRGLYPIQIDDYRTVALAAYFPYWQGRTLINQNAINEGLKYLWRSQVTGRDVLWLESNISHLYSVLAYEKFQAGNFELSVKIYKQWINVRPQVSQPYVNLGVVYEKMGRNDDAQNIYLQAMELFPSAWDPPYNLAVLSWKKADWPAVVNYFEEVLKRNPTHAQAKSFLEAARNKMGNK